MDARRKEIDRLDGEIRRLEQQVSAEGVEIGRRAAVVAPAQVRSEELARFLNSADTLRRSMDAIGVEIDRIRTLARGIDERVAEIEAASQSRDQILKERRARFVELGAGCFAIFRSLPDGAAYRPVFEEILKLDRESEARNTELKTMQEQEQAGGFFDRLKLKARKVMVRGEISRLDRVKSAAYEHAGEKIAATDFARFAEGELRHLFDAMGERQAAADAAGAENERRAREIDEQRRELKRLGADGRVEERVRELEKRIDALKKEMEVIHGWIGRLIVEHGLHAELKDEVLAKGVDAVLGLREAAAAKRRAIDRLRAEMEMEEIARREKERRLRRRQLEEEMRVKERQIGTLDIEINVGLRRLEELKRVVAGEIPYVESPPLPPLPELYPPGEDESGS